MLTALEYLEGDTVTPRGRHLQRIYSDMDLVAAESLRHGLWDELSPAELAAALSALVFEARRPDDASAPRLPGGRVQEVLAEMVRLWGELDALEREHKLDFLREPDLGFAWAAYRWAEGDDLDDVLGETELAAGDFVRWMKQLLDLAGQVADAAGDSALRETAREVVRPAPARRGRLLRTRRTDRPPPAIGVSPPTRSHWAPTVVSAPSTAATTAATSARGTAPRATSGPSATRPVPGSSVRRPGRRIVQARSLARRAASASRFASTYAFQTGAVSSGSGSSTPMAETWTKREMPARRAPSTDFSEPSRSTVRLRSMLPSGPPPAAKTTAAQPVNACGEGVLVLLLDVEQADLGAQPLELGAVLLVPDQGDRDVPGRDQLRMEMTGHLTVAPDDCDATHGSTVRVGRWAAP